MMGILAMYSPVFTHITMDHSFMLTESYIKFLKDQVNYYRFQDVNSNYYQVISLSNEIHVIERTINEISGRLAIAY